MAVVTEVMAKLDADVNGFTSGFQRAQRSANDLTHATGAVSASAGGMSGSMKKAGIAAAAGFAIAGAALVAIGVSSVKAATEAQKATARLDAIATSMGVMDQTLGGSTQRLQDFATEMSMAVGVEDEAIMASQSLLLTFSNLASSAGEAGGMFDRATKAAFDLSAAGFGPAASSSKALGKALQDPIKGMTALGRSGVTFTAAEKEQVKAMLAVNDMAGAQNLIMSAVETQVGGTAAAVVTDAEKMKVAFGELQETLGMALVPVVQEMSRTLTPILQSLQEPLKAIAGVVSGALTAAFNAFSPLIPVMANAMATFGQAITGGLVAALQALMPALIPLAAMWGQIATQIAPILATVLGTVAKVLAKVLGAITPLIGPLASVFLNILSAAMPVVDVLAGLLMILVDALAPVLAAVVQLIKPFGDLISLGFKAMAPILKPLLPIINALAQILSLVLVKAIGVLMYALGWLVQGWAKLGPFMTNNVGIPVVKAFLYMAEQIVRAAKDMLGWIPGMEGKFDGLLESIQGFSDDGVAAMANAADLMGSEGARIGEEMTAAGQAAMASSSAELGASAADLGTYVAGQYGSALTKGMNAWGARYAAQAPPKATLIPPPVIPTSTGSAAAKEAKKSNKEIVDTLFADVKDTIKRIEDAVAIVKAKTTSAVGSILGDGVKALTDSIPGIDFSKIPDFLTPIEQALGAQADFSSISTMFGEMESAVNDYYGALLDMPGITKKAEAGAKAAREQALTSLRAGAATAIRLVAEREAINRKLQQADADYAKQVEGINANYDALDLAAANNLKAIQDKWDKAIPLLEGALSKANAAFEKENSVLQGLIGERTGYLNSIASGFRSFLNSLTSAADGGTTSFADSLKARLKSIQDFQANVKALIARGLDPTLVRDFVAAGVDSAGGTVAALAGATAEEIASINASQTALAGEVASFQSYAAEQWFNSGIAAQQAIVSPLETAATTAATALALAQSTRTQELANAQAHIDSLKVLRDAELNQAKADYKVLSDSLIAQGVEVDKQLAANATAVNGYFSGLNLTLPPEMIKLGAASVAGLIKGLDDMTPALKAKASAMGRAVTRAYKDALDINSPSRVMADIGEQIVLGLIQGMEATEGVMVKAAAGIADSASKPFTAGVGAGFTGGVIEPLSAATGGSVTIEPGAVQINFAEASSLSSVEMQAIVDQALMNLAREIRRTM